MLSANTLETKKSMAFHLLLLFPVTFCHKYVLKQSEASATNSVRAASGGARR